MASRRSTRIDSVFAKWLGARARQLAAERPRDFRIVDQGDFPPGAPLHEDGSTTYDPQKPLVLFALQMNNKQAIKTWDRIVAEFGKMKKKPL